MNKIKSIFGQEPRRDGEYPEGFTVGYGGVSRIEYREDNFGPYGIGWFDVYHGDTLVSSMNATAVAVVNYFNDNDFPEQSK